MRALAALILLTTMPAASALNPGVALGVDLGTSGVRVAVVEADGASTKILGEAATGWSDADGRRPEVWLAALQETISKCDAVARVQRISVSGTSSSTLVVDTKTGGVARAPMMYNDAVACDRALAAIEANAPAGHTVRSATSALAKLLAWAVEAPLGADDVVCHQADFVAAALATGSAAGLAPRPVLESDWHNALKMGFDVEALRWPAWIVDGALPAVGARPGALAELDVLRPGAAGRRVVLADNAWGLPAGAPIVGGTTDSIAAFLACSVDGGAVRVEPGRAVTSLGSTTALKLVSDVKIDDAATGVYSHRLDDAWLVGGASSAGCRVLRDFKFSDDELRTLSETLDAGATNAAGIYPLSAPGERFPFNDPGKQPVLPDAADSDRARVLHELLTGIADVERLGYLALKERGATPLVSVQTAGGGARNPQWRALRETMLGVPVLGAENSEAAFGAAALALRG